MAGAYQGFVPHIYRNTIAGAAHIGAFETLRHNIAKKRGIQVGELPQWITLSCGAMGGFAYWGLFYPIDVLKSATQGDSPWKE